VHSGGGQILFSEGCVWGFSVIFTHPLLAMITCQSLFFLSFFKDMIPPRVRFGDIKDMVAQKNAAASSEQVDAASADGEESAAPAPAAADADADADEDGGAGDDDADEMAS
jgi:hypothetical protein